jgi:beta-lactamase regulating signal transducer with metallopeptidase domain
MNAQTIQMVGTALLHFFWQGAALAVLLLLAISFTRNARVRHSLAVYTLALMALCPFATLAFLGNPPAAEVSVPAVNYSAISNVTVSLATPAPVTSFDLLTCLVWVWCSGVCLFGVRAFGGWLMLQKMRRTAREAISPALLESCRRLQQRIGINAMVRYAYSEIVDAPAVVGWFRPLVLIPLSAMAGLSVEQFEAIIAHELAHVRRYDALVNLFQIAVETVLFYHPAVWWVNRVIRTERENCCDDIAVAVCGNASEYARALAMIGGAAGARPAWAMAANGGALKARVGRLLGMQKITHGIPRAGLAVLAVLCASCVVLAAGVFKQDTPNTPPLPPPPAAPAEPLPLLSPPDPDSISSTVQRNVEIDRVEETLKQLTRRLAEAEANKHTVTAVHMRDLQIAAERDELERMITSMKSRYVDDYPDLIAAKDRLAELTRDMGGPAEDAPDQKPEEHSGSYIDSLESVGLTKLSVDDLISLKIQGVTADYVRQIKAAGIDPNIHELITLKIQGVSPEYIQGIHATGLKPNVHELISMKVQDVTPELIRALESAGLGNLQIHDFIAAKIQGVTPEFIEKVRSHGFKDLTFHQLLSLKIAGVF